MIKQPTLQLLDHLRWNDPNTTFIVPSVDEIVQKTWLNTLGVLRYHAQPVKKTSNGLK